MQLNKFLLTAIIILLGIFFIRFHSAPASSDAYWHLAVGRQIFTEKKVSHFDNFTYVTNNPVYTTTEWLSGLILFIFVKYFGFGGLLFLRFLIGVAILFLLYKTVLLFTDNLLLVISTVVTVSYVLAFRMNDRPETFSFLLLSLTNYLFFYYYFRNSLNKLTYLLPLVFLLWPNIHPFGIIAVTLFVFWVLLYFIRGRFLGLKKEEFGRFLFIFLTAFFLFVIQYKKVFVFLVVPTLKIPELSSLFFRITQIKGYHFFDQIPFDIYLFLVFFLIIFMTVLALLLKKRLKLPEIFISCFYLSLFLLGIRFYRLIPVAMLLSVPWFINLVFGLWAKNKFLRIFLFVELCFLVTLILGTVFFGSLLGDRSFAIYNLNESGKPVAVMNNSWFSEYPHDASKFISDNLNSNRIYSIVNWNNYFVWANNGVKIFRDAQGEYLTAQIDKEEGILRLGKEGWEKMLEKYNIDTVVNTNGEQFRTSETPVFNLNNWKLVYVDDVAQVYARQDIIKNMPLDLSAIRPQLPGELKFGSNESEKAVEQLNALFKYDNKNSFARQQLILYYLSNNKIEEAKELSEQSRVLIPNNPWFSAYLSIIYANYNDCNMAREFADEAKEKSYQDFNILKRLKDVLSVKCKPR